MEGFDYPIEHFQLMSEVAKRLKSFGVQLLEATYACRTFGSWWLAFQVKGENYRIVWDGRDERLRLDADKGLKASFGYEWIEDVELETHGLHRDTLIQKIETLIERAMS